MWEARRHFRRWWRMKQSRKDIQVFARLLNLIYPRRCPMCDGIVGGPYGTLICRHFRRWWRMKQSRKDIQVFARLLNLIYPRRCPMCDGIVGGPYGTLICPECEKCLRRVREPVCKKCGKPLDAEETEYCTDCAGKSHVYTRGMAALEYGGLMKASIGRFKYHNRREYADFYARELFRLCSDAVRAWEPDALIPIPLHRSRLRKRGFNQADGSMQIFMRGSFSGCAVTRYGPGSLTL